MSAFDEFAPLTQTDRPALSGILARYPEPLSWYSFTTLRLWDPVFHYRWRLLADRTLLVATTPEDVATQHILQPLGPFGPTSATALLDLAAHLPYPLRIYGVGEAFLEAQAPLVAHFSVRLERDMSEYLYRATDLVDLPGRRYNYKRSLVARAHRAAHLTVVPLTAANLEACDEVMRRRDEATQLPDTNNWLARETLARMTAFEHFGELELEGIVVLADGEPAAFALFEAQKGSVGVIHFERARREISGLYQIVNQEAARALAARGCTTINRQDDAGLLGLRQAKNSYHPSAMINCYVLEYQGDRH